MKNQVNNSQSTEAINSAVLSFSYNSGCRKRIEIPLLDFNRDSIITWVGEAVKDKRRDVRFLGYVIKGRVSIIVYLTKDSSSKNYSVVYTIFDDYNINREKSGRIDLDFKVLSGTNINKAVGAITRALEKLPYYAVASNEIEAIEEAEVSEAPCLDEKKILEEAPCLDEKKILEDYCANEASKIMDAGLTSVALTNNADFYLYDYESLYNYLVSAGFDADRAYEIRDQYDEEVDRAIRGLLTSPDFEPVEVTGSDIESTEIFWDDITFPYSAKGLAYVLANTRRVDMADILKKVAEFHWDFKSVVRESRWTRFTYNTFMDLIWSTCWSEYLVKYTDEGLEAETRYIMDFDSVYDDLFDVLWPYMTSYDDSFGGCGCSELWVDSWYVVERAAEIIEDYVANFDTRCICWDEFPDYIMTAFLGHLYGFKSFTEHVMSELEGGDIIDILPYDDGLYLSFVGDEAEIAE